MKPRDRDGPRPVNRGRDVSEVCVPSAWPAAEVVGFAFRGNPGLVGPLVVRSAHDCPRRPGFTHAIVGAPEAGWVRTDLALPPEGVAVETKVDDANAGRNLVTLRRGGRLWFHPDMTTYVYYEPTHWRRREAPDGRA